MKRVVIVDFNHRVHIHMNAGYRAMQEIEFNGKKEYRDTSIQNGLLKDIHRWSKGGSCPTAICFDSPVPARKAYFARNFGMAVEGDEAYKGRRVPLSGEVFEAIEMTKDILIKAGVSCYKGNNYEADDLIFACIESAKKDYPDYKIDVITNDADLLPLVDDTVSVFLRSRKFTWAENRDLEKKNYIQVTPDNYQELVEGLSSYNKFSVPYNTLLFNKLVRGDVSDNIKNSIKKQFPPKKYNDLIFALDKRGFDLPNLFRYGKCRVVYRSIKTGEVVDANHPKEDLFVRYEDPIELDRIVDVLCWYYDDETIEYIKKMYRGMNLNQAYMDMGSISRRPARIGKPIQRFSEGELQEQINKVKLGIHLPMHV